MLDALLNGLYISWNATCRAGEDGPLDGPPEGLEASLGKLSTTLANWFPLWVAAGCLLALWHPPVALWFRKDYVTAGLATTMLAMGTTLTLKVCHASKAAPVLAILPKSAEAVKLKGKGNHRLTLVVIAIAWMQSDQPTLYIHGMARHGMARHSDHQNVFKPQQSRNLFEQFGLDAGDLAFVPAGSLVFLQDFSSTCILQLPGL